MKLNNLILAMVALATVIAVNTANAQNDGWQRTFSNAPADTLRIVKGYDAYQGIYYMAIRLRGTTRYLDSVRYGRKFSSAIPFQGIFKVRNRGYGLDYGCVPSFNITLYYGGSAISSSFVITGEALPGQWYGAAFYSWSGTLSAFDSLAVMVRLWGGCSALYGGVDLDYFCVTLYGVDSLFYTAGDWGEISGTVWHDTLLNAFKDPLEPGMAGWPLYLSGTEYDTAVTDTNGYYHFDKLPPGNYQVSLGLLPSWDQVYPLDNYQLDLNPFATLSYYNTNFGVTLAGATKIPVRKGWHMLSLLVKPLSLAKADLFPSPISDAYWYNGSGYQTAETLEVGKGYWLKFPRDQYVFMSGDSIACDTVAVTEGWNLVGALSAPVAVEDIGSSVPEMELSQFFGYSGSYFFTDSLHPGQGYWVKANQTGELIIPMSGGSPLYRVAIKPTDELPPQAPGELVTSSSPLVPKKFDLLQNYPNPFNPTTTIRYEIPKQVRDDVADVRNNGAVGHAELGSASQHVTLKVYNLLGQEVETLVNKVMKPGSYEVQFDGTKLPSGIYIYRLQAGNKIANKKMVLIK